MSAVGASAVAPGRVGSKGLAIIASLLVALVVGWLANWAAGAALLLLGLVVVARPFDVPVSLLLVAGVAVFAEYGDPHIHRDLLIVTMLTTYAVVAFLVAVVSRRWKLPVNGHADALLALGVTSLIGAAHGILAHNAIRYMFLELLPLLSLLFALCLGGVRLRPADLRWIGRALVVIGLGSAALGYYYFATTGMRTQGVYYTPVPGLVAIVVLVRMLFEPSSRPRWGPLAVFAVLIGHQVLTFTRGYWLAMMIALPVALALYVRRGEGVGRRWRKVTRVIGVLGILAVVLASVGTALLGTNDVLGMLGVRFFSSFETKDTPETVSNVIRLIEFRTALMDILRQPLFGYGHGSTLVVRQTYFAFSGPQWWVHESYMMIWLKQGILGFAALIWVVVSAVVTGVRGMRHPDPTVAGWAAASAAGTIFTAVVCLTNYHFFMVTLTYLMAVLWGISLSFAPPGRRRFVWRRSPAGGGAKGVT